MGLGATICHFLSKKNNSDRNGKSNLDEDQESTENSN